MNTNDEHQLSHQQQRFCDEYLVHFNAFKAAVNAGYSDNTARKGELLHLPKVQYYLQDAMRKTQSRLQITHDMILSELAKIAFSNMGNYYDEYAVLKPMNQLTNDEKAAISQYQIMDAMDDQGQRIGELSKIKLHNKMAALDRIACHLGFYGTLGVQNQESRVKNQEEESIKPKAESLKREESPKSESLESGLLVATPTKAGEVLSRESEALSPESVSLSPESKVESPELESELSVVSGEKEVLSPESEVRSQTSFQHSEEEHTPAPLFPIAIGRESRGAGALEHIENFENILTLSPLLKQKQESRIRIQDINRFGENGEFALGIEADTGRVIKACAV